MGRGAEALSPDMSSTYVWASPYMVDGWGSTCLSWQWARWRAQAGGAADALTGLRPGRAAAAGRPPTLMAC